VIGSFQGRALKLQQGPSPDISWLIVLLGKYKEKCHKNTIVSGELSWQLCDLGRQAGEVLLLTLP